MKIHVLSNLIAGEDNGNNIGVILRYPIKIFRAQHVPLSDGPGKVKLSVGQVEVKTLDMFSPDLAPVHRPGILWLFGKKTT